MKLILLIASPLVILLIYMTISKLIKKYGVIIALNFETYLPRKRDGDHLQFSYKCG